MNNNRINITKKLRFEVFKRDSFTCQYCGRKSPDVVLNVDHINPVKRGGKNDILNLITSCFDCNSGKKDRLLDDNSVIKKQQQQLEKLNERRIQLEMMVKWRDELQELEDKKVELIINAINSNMEKYVLSDVYKKQAKTLVKKYDVELILKAIDISASRYLSTNSKQDNEEYISKISGILKNLSLPIVEQKVNFIAGYLSKEYYKQFWQVKNVLMEYCNALKTYWNYSDEQIINDLETDVRKEEKSCYSFSDFEGLIDSWIHQIKNKKP